MIRLRRHHWALAFGLAMALHLAAYVYVAGRPAGAPVYRGGGTFEQGDAPASSAAAVFVQLGNSWKSAGDEVDSAALREEAPEVEAPEPVTQGVVAEEILPEPEPEPEPKVQPPEPPQVVEAEPIAEAESEPVETPAEVVPEEEVEAVVEEAETPLEEVAEETLPEAQVAAVPLPRRKPTRQMVLPEMETLGRRLSVQQPAEPARAAVKTDVPPAESAREGTETSAGTAEGDAETPALLNFASQQASAGTAGGDKTGEVRELNYEDQVLLWLKRNGSYPYEAAMYRLEDVVTLKFAINRQGRILYFELIKKSQYHLLNKAVERMMVRASPVPPIPQEIAKEEMVFTIPVRFHLELKG